MAQWVEGGGGGGAALHRDSIRCQVVSQMLVRIDLQGGGNHIRMHAVTSTQTCEPMAGCTAILSQGTEARKARGGDGWSGMIQTGAGVIYLLYSPFCSNAPLNRE